MCSRKTSEWFHIFLMHTPETCTNPLKAFSKSSGSRKNELFPCRSFLPSDLRCLILYSMQKIVLIHKNIFASWSKSYPFRGNRNASLDVKSAIIAEKKSKNNAGSERVNAAGKSALKSRLETVLKFNFMSRKAEGRKDYARDKVSLVWQKRYRATTKHRGTNSDQVKRKNLINDWDLNDNWEKKNLGLKWKNHWKRWN